VAYPTGATGDARVVLIITVNDDGTVREAVPAEVHEPFSSAAVAGALTWRFDPAMRNGKPTSAKVKIEDVFHPTPQGVEPSPDATSPDPVTRDASTAGGTRAAPTPVEEVRVRGARGEPSRTASLGRAEVRQIPGTFGDPFRAVEVMPGVTPIVSGLPFF